ncbi:hypothetical protein [Metabacillus fastidiosus]|uniref:Uncharacterized protein n=1 Tax=Metabacillus fastidiosus TaxID=1458 RepID=A0ABU6NXI0_9BACI|nr:hypothetical protein [Metabacillus fastidiosus]MED4401353.1 hypothetical protein [Metabacillus fastidiosus]MED4462990.1 hypothetical protein [Metabacillus fastidiosus]
MAEKFSFFDPVQDQNGQYDREYNAQEFTNYFAALVTTGLMKGSGNELKVTATGSNMVTTIDTDIAFLLGRFYENDSLLLLTHDTETLGNSRIDRIVVRMDLSTEARYVKAFIKKGISSASPVAPTLTQTPNLYEISLAQVKVIGGQTFISINNVTNERGKDIICPYAGSKILPNFDDTGLEALVNKVEQMNNLKADKTQENGISLPYQAGFASSGNGCFYYKDSFGVVHIGGKFNKITTMGSAVLCTLPVGYRPKNIETRYFITWVSPNYVINEMTISTTGAVTIYTPATGGISVELSFRTAD